MSAENINLWVSGGNFDAPYYQFYTNAEGTEKLSGLSLDTAYTYTFRRLGGATSHPFYLSDTGFKEASTDAISIDGYGSPSAGITGDQAFTVSFNGNAGDIGDLLYYCTSHSSMQGNIQLMEASAAAPIIRGNSLYTIVDGPSQELASQQSKKLGGELVTINDEDEGKFIANTSIVENHPVWGLWIGLKIRDGLASWMSNETVDYTNWMTGQPSGDGDGSNADIHLWSGTSDYVTGEWNDVPQNWATPPEQTGEIDWLSGIAEIPFIRRGDSAYVIVEGSTWEEAEANAVALGGHLVTINDAEENDWLLEVFDIEGIHPIDSLELQRGSDYSQPTYWIGYNDVDLEGSWEWSSGEFSAFSHWLDGALVGGTGTPNGSFSQNYAVIGGYSNGAWDDQPNASTMPNHQGGIAEIPLAPNNAPTGTPTLTGDYTVGQVISIDASAIDDADNFEGWTPSYEYSWEVSNDNGTTWTSLTSADSTDGDDSYTLTSAEVGTQLRGVVSYLDGYGTTEMVVGTGELIESSENGGIPIDAQVLSLVQPDLITIRSGHDTSTAITYNVDESNKQLTGISASLYFDSTQVTIDFADDPYQSSLLGYGITTDSSDGDNDPATDSIVALSYTDFLGNFPGSSVSLPLTLADLTITPTENYTGTTLNLRGTGAIGYDVIGDTLTLGYDAAPVVAQPIGDLSVDALSPWSYTLPTNLFFDPDSDLTLSIDSDLPSWVSYDPDTTTFSGTPSSSADSFEVVLSSADDLGSVTTSFDLNVRDVQIIHPESNTMDYQGGQRLALPLVFSATDGKASTGLAFQLHYDSSLFAFSSIDNPISGMTIFDYDTSADIADADNDPETDTVLNVTIASFDGSLASGSQLGIFNFEVADLPPADPDDPDPITGLRPSVMNLTASSTATGYGFAADPITLEPVLFNLDVDGDGQVTALGDGLMVIRKLFGPAFAGDALTNKAISPDATRTTQEIHDYIQSGIDGGYLDIDLDDDTTALGDGLMVIRRLFGPAFSNEKLIDKAISPRSKMLPPGRPFHDLDMPGKADLALQIAGRIDALIPEPTFF